MGDPCEFGECDFTCIPRDDLFFNGYDYNGIQGLHEFALKRHKHIIMPFSFEYCLKVKGKKFTPRGLCPVPIQVIQLSPAD